MTAESGGTKAGCVRWSVRSMPRPTSRHPQQQLVYFIFTNDCGRNVGVQIASQTADLAQRTSTHGSILLEPEQTYGTAKTIRNYIFFDAPQHRFLNFWIFQSDEPFTAARMPDMSRCVPGFRPVQNIRRNYPPCPPGFRFGQL